MLLIIVILLLLLEIEKELVIKFVVGFIFKSCFGYLLIVSKVLGFVIFVSFRFSDMGKLLILLIFNVLVILFIIGLNFRIFLFL